MEIPEAYATAEKIAKEAGFKLMAFADAATIELRQEVRDMCAANTCGKYGSNWACPPGCGELDECRAKVAPYKWGIIVQTTGQLEDDFDIETMQETAKKHGDNFVKMLLQLRKEHPELDVLPLGTGACMNCKKCTYPDAPCRFPDRMSSPMEGYGMVISDVCKDNNIVYNHGRGTLTYVACYLFREARSA